jgi:hypothetical protein
LNAAVTNQTSRLRHVCDGIAVLACSSRGVDVVSGNLNGARAADALVYDFPKESKNRGGCALEKPVNRPAIVAA